MYVSINTSRLYIDDEITFITAEEELKALAQRIPTLRQVNNLPATTIQPPNARGNAIVLSLCLIYLC